MKSSWFLHHARPPARVPVVLLACLFALAACTGAFADTKGKLTGRIVDAKNQPVLGANVQLVGTTLGAAASEDGYYLILNVPVGGYTARVSAVGYQTNLVKEVRLSAGQTTTLNVTIIESVISMGEVTSVAEKPLVDTRQTSSVAILSKDDINALPVQSLTDVVNLQAGVVDGHFRGGRAGEVQYQVDGVSVNNPYDNSSVVQLDKSVLQEVQVITGTFDAEFGQAMSGVVNAILRSGSDEKYEASAEAYGGEYATQSSGPNGFPYVKSAFPPPVQSYTVSLSGPSGIPKTTFLVNARRFRDDGYLYGQRRFLPADTTDFSRKIFVPSGDNATVAMNDHREWSGQVKISNRSLPDVQISYQAIGGIVEGHRYDFNYRFNPDGIRTQKTLSLVHGIDWTHTLSDNTFYTVSLRQNYFKYTDFAFASAYDPAYYAAGAPRSDPNYELGAIIQGYDIGRFEQKTNTVLIKVSLTSQVSQAHLFKFGIETQSSALGFGAPTALAYDIVSGTQSTIRVIPDTLATDFREYHPIAMAAFLQDRVEVLDFLIRAGLRLEYFDANATVPGNLENPANAIRGAPPSIARRTTRKLALAPRLGMSYPISATGALYFSYGHFYQMPEMQFLYSNSDYSVLRNLQAGIDQFGVLGNPDIKPEFTVQYEFGFKQQFGQTLGLDVSAFYKDIRNLLGVEFIDSYADARYARFTNVDFGSVNGIKLSLDQRLGASLSLSLNYTYENAVGNSSDPNETAVRAASGQDARPRVEPFDWDQRHTVNLAGSWMQQDDLSITIILRYGSGSPYTPAVNSAFGAQLETNSSVKPAWTSLDVRAEKYFHIGSATLTVFARALNLTDERFANGSVFASTGSPYYSTSPAADREALADPSRFAPPRRVEAGVGIRF
jgi:outer membrane receptor protein involved in Fe transport